MKANSFLIMFICLLAGLSTASAGGGGASGAMSYWKCSEHVMIEITQYHLLKRIENGRYVDARPFSLDMHLVRNAVMMSGDVYPPQQDPHRPTGATIGTLQWTPKELNFGFPDGVIRLEIKNEQPLTCVFSHRY